MKLSGTSLLPALFAGFALLLGACQTSPAATPAAPSSPSPVETATPAVSTGTGTGTGPGTTAAPSAARPGDFAGTQAHLHVRQLADAIGSRPTGSQSEREAADYLADRFARLGYSSQQLSFEFEDYEERSVSLAVTAPSPENLQVAPMRFSPGGSVTGNLIPAGIGRPEDLPPGLSGNIALMERGSITFAEKVANAARAGAVAAVIYNNQPGEFRGNLGSLARIPAASITAADGQRLLDLAQQGNAQARLSVEASNRRVESRNVLARAGDACRIIIGGHYDSVAEGPGANDNASGTAVTLEAARVLRDQAAAQGLCFMAFGAEELGLWGSRRFVESLSAPERERILAFINLDMVGVGTEWRVSGSEGLRDLAAESSQSLGIEIQAFGGDTRQDGGSDHASFLRAGVPAVFLHRRSDPNYHTPEDKAEFVDPAALEQAGRIVVEMVNRLAARG